MTRVKATHTSTSPADTPPLHLANLLERLGKQFSRDLSRQRAFRQLGAEAPEVRGSAFRALSHIPDKGGRITDIAAHAGITKQALGQFVDSLERFGYVASHRDPADRRSRIVVRTRKGDRAVRSANRMFAELEGEWRARVGAVRWDIFRDVLVELTSDTTGGSGAAHEPRR